MTQSLHYIPEAQRSEAPPSARLSKVYSQSDVAAIISESEDIQDYGAGTFDEWKKGLRKRGIERMADAARWEVWEKNLSTDKPISQVLREYDLPLLLKSRDVTTSTGTRVGRPPVAPNGKQPSKPIFSSSASPNSCSVFPFDEHPVNSSAECCLPHSQDLITAHILTSRPGTSTPSIKFEYDYTGATSAPPHATAHQNGVHVPSMKFEFDHTGATSASPYATPAYQNGVQAPSGSSYGQDFTQASTTKLPQGIQAARQARRADIERRCMSLNPPIPPEVLQHATSFKNAMVVTQPMTDTAWNVLRPRLESQREEAEAMEQQRQYQLQIAEHKRQTDMAYLQSAIPTTPQDILRPARDVYSEAYENAQKPLREKLAAYADEFIQDEWRSVLLHRHNCPQFAAGCIEWVYKRDTQDEARRGGAPISSPTTQHYARQAGHQEPRPFLSLDNMKWVFENKIKPLTDPHCKELFTCAECPEAPRGYTKHFAFEGLIQHYGAKHDSEFGIENVVVHWQTAKWPDEPPFVIPRAPAPRVVNNNRDGRNGSGHTDNRPPLSRNGPSRTPRPQLLSESPYFSSPSTQPAGHHAGVHQQKSASQDGIEYGQPGHTTTPSRDCPYVDTSNTAQVEKLVTDALEIWNALDGVKDLELPIRMHTVIYHTNQRFIGRFRQFPSLDTVTEALASDERMLPIKKANGLICTGCVAAQTDGSATASAYYTRILHMTPFNVSSLVTHFKIVHLPNRHHADWGTNMIELPEDKVVKKLLRTPGMDDAKLRLIAAAFHTVFPTPLPTIGLIPASDASASKGSLVDRMLNPKKGNQERKSKKGGNDVSAKTKRRESEALSDAKEDEYDPRRPAYISHDKPAFDPARYDTQYDTGVAQQSTRTASYVDLNRVDPEILAAALANYAPRSPDLSLLPLRNQDMTSEQPLQHRRPSVGAREPPPRQPDSGTPNIAAILAALTGQQQPAALEHNDRAFEHNLACANTAQQPFSAAAAPPSPPRLRYVYENAPPAFEQPPVQWVQVPAASARPPQPQHTRPSYSGSGAPLPPVFYDENGRQIQVVAAPPGSYGSQPGGYYQ